MVSTSSKFSREMRVVKVAHGTWAIFKCFLDGLVWSASVTMDSVVLERYNDVLQMRFL